MSKIINLVTLAAAASAAYVATTGSSVSGGSNGIIATADAHRSWGGGRHGGGGGHHNAYMAEDHMPAPPMSRRRGGSGGEMMMDGSSRQQRKQQGQPMALNGATPRVKKQSPANKANSKGGPFDDLQYYGYNHKTNPISAIVVGNTTRFTVMADQMVRVQYNKKNSNSAPSFEDRATLMAVNRWVDQQFYTNHYVDAEGFFHLITPKIEVIYRVGAEFAPDTLSMKLLDGTNRQWSYGDHDDGNLFGTIRSLDMLCTISLNCTENKDVLINAEQNHCAFGVVSKHGWAVVNDTKNYIMPAADDTANNDGTNLWFGAEDRATDDVDLYLFGHGNDYRKAIKDYTQMAGKVPMPRRQMWGAWFTRWFDYANTDIEQLIDNFEKYSLPLDVLVLDMNWHTKNDWTGYSWDRQLYPIPKDTIDLIRSKKLLWSVNLHDADGVGYWEDSYGDMCQVMGMDPQTEVTVPFLPLNKTYFHALDDIALEGIGGSDIWWIDWQQGGWCNGGCDGYQMNPTFLTDHVRSTNNIRNGREERDAILARWGGLGGHRYPVGFTGDVLFVDWGCFAYQPYFSATAANVAHGTLSHDLMGPVGDEELEVRWLQFGAFSGILRIHDRGDSSGWCWPDCDVVDMWRLPEEYFKPIRDVMTMRVGLLPYIYTNSRATFEDGIPLVYPMYYDFPTLAEAYRLDANGSKAQYMFGPQILFAPITTKMDPTTNLVNKSVWLPPGQWYDDVRGAVISVPTNSDGLVLETSYALNEVPLFYKGGAIIPRIPHPSKVGAASKQFSEYDIHIYPSGEGGITNNSYTLYDDDGQTYKYINANPADVSYTTIAYTRSADRKSITLTIGAASSAVSGPTRTVRIFLVGSQPVVSATYAVAGGGDATAATLSYSRFDKFAPNTFSYDGVTATASVSLSPADYDKAMTITIQLAAAQNDADFAYFKGWGSRTIEAKHSTDNYRATPGSTVVGWGYAKEAAARGGLLTALANPTDAPTAQFQSLLASGSNSYLSLIQLAIKDFEGTLPPLPPLNLPSFVQLWDAERKDMLLCGTVPCLTFNSYYEVMWVEGFQPAADADSAERRRSSQSAAPTIASFNDYWSDANNDNWGDVDPSGPLAANYTTAIFTNGNVMTSAFCAADTININSGNTTTTACLQLWYSAANTDHMTLASQQGEEWAKSNGYSLLKPCMGYVYTAAPTTTSSPSAEQMRRQRRVLAAASALTAADTTTAKRSSSLSALLKQLPMVVEAEIEESDTNTKMLQWVHQYMATARAEDSKNGIDRRAVNSRLAELKKGVVSSTMGGHRDGAIAHTATHAVTNSAQTQPNQYQHSRYALAKALQQDATLTAAFGNGKQPKLGSADLGFLYAQALMVSSLPYQL